MDGSQKPVGQFCMTNPRDHQPALPLPDGLTRDQILESLITLTTNGSAVGELENYAREDCERFIHTLDLIPADARKVLEIGGGPYFTSTLIRRHRPEIDLSLTNYFTVSGGTATDVIGMKGYDGEQETHRFTYHNCNVEKDPFPWADNSFDCVLFCEVIEHLLSDPMFALLEIHRVLKPGGSLVLTTPNVSRLENVARMIAGANIYDPYSGYGPYGRHNREYNRHELFYLLKHCGFECERFFTGDVHDNHALAYAPPEKLAGLLDGREYDLGQYHFTVSRKRGEPDTRRPSWLYRSLPEEQMAMISI